ncbi:Hypothetical predicted protein [Paramuricea clavata]|uniref:Uncharacterized protein n=1 Tax=Paramuricea clavata TaxID=317549 RepID=A0A6S7JKY3_PARCT|nr:Hypothetical predicted protein [Paramuricea clavata]
MEEKTISTATRQNSWYATLTLDCLKRRVYLIFGSGNMNSMDYDGGNKIKIISDASIYSFVLGIIENTLYFRERHSPAICKMNATNWTISRKVRVTIPAWKRIVVTDRSMQPEGN